MTSGGLTTGYHDVGVRSSSEMNNISVFRLQDKNLNQLYFVHFNINNVQRANGESASPILPMVPDILPEVHPDRMQTM
jgi:hypothetical protein